MNFPPFNPDLTDPPVELLRRGKNMNMIVVEVVRADGTLEPQELYRPRFFAELRQILYAPLGFKSFNLRDGRVMIVDEMAYHLCKTLNMKAVEIFKESGTQGQMPPLCGDVAIVRDSDWE